MRQTPCRRARARPAAIVAPWYAAVLLASPATWAQATDPWTFQAALYGYLPSVSGQTTFPGGGGSDIAVDASALIENLKFTFMGSLEASNGRWGLATDVVYLNLGNSTTQSRDLAIGGVPLPADASADIGYDLKSWVVTLAGTWRALNEPASKLDVIGGTRMLSMKQTLDWRLSGNLGSIALPDRAGRRRVEETHWDAIVGIKGRAAFGDAGHWFVPYYADIGSGESSFTWQAMTGLGYTFGWGDVAAVWRHLDYKMKSGQPIESASFSGPAIAAVFHW